MSGESTDAPVTFAGTEPQQIISAMAQWVRNRLDQHPQQRLIVGLTGSPGSGKSSIASLLAAELSDLDARIAPMDGFHLAQSVIDGTELATRKGAIDTFDAEGYVHLVERLRSRVDSVVYAPEYRRGVEESIGSALAIPRECSVVITEGNYLLAPHVPWLSLRELLDAIWFVETPEALRLSRLVARHIESGRSPESAEVWAAGPDQSNAQTIEKWRASATGTVYWL